MSVASFHRLAAAQPNLYRDPHRHHAHAFEAIAANATAQAGRDVSNIGGTCGMNLYLRKVVHPQAHDNYRVVLKRDGDEFEIGSIGIQHDAAWRWGIDTVIPLRAHE